MCVTWRGFIWFLGINYIQCPSGMGNDWGAWSRPEMISLVADLEVRQSHGANSTLVVQSSPTLMTFLRTWYLVRFTEGILYPTHIPACTQNTSYLCDSGARLVHNLQRPLCSETDHLSGCQRVDVDSFEFSGFRQRIPNEILKLVNALQAWPLAENSLGAPLR